jgi:hypothetical protein
MKIEIQAENDDNFSIVNELQTDVASETVASETVENAPGVISKAPRSAPIENNQGPGWFSGTSWG